MCAREADEGGRVGGGPLRKAAKIRMVWANVSKRLHPVNNGTPAFDVLRRHRPCVLVLTYGGHVLSFSLSATTHTDTLTHTYPHRATTHIHIHTQYNNMQTYTHKQNNNKETQTHIDIPTHIHTHIHTQGASPSHPVPLLLPELCMVVQPTLTPAQVLRPLNVCLAQNLKTLFISAAQPHPCT